MKILVTGGAGFIGSHLVDQLVNLGDQVAVADNLVTGLRSNVNPKAKFFEADIKDQKALNRIFAQEKVEAVAHLAAQKSVTHSVRDPVRDAQENIIGSLNLFEAMRASGVKKIVFASTGGALYGETDVLPTPEDQPLLPESPYGIAKMTVEHYLRFYAQTCQFKSVILRLANVYGPRQDPKGEAGVVAIFCQRILDNQPVTIFGDGRQTRDYIYVDDVAAAFVKALKGKYLGVYNIGTAQESSVLDLVRLLSKASETTVKVNFQPERAGELRRSCLKIAKASRSGLLNKPAILSEGIKSTLRFFKD